MGLIFENLIPKIYISCFDALPQLWHASYENLLSGESSANKTLPGARETCRHIVAMRNPKQMFFDQLRFENDSFVSEKGLAT